MPALAPPFALRDATEADRAFIEALTARSYRDLVIRQFGMWDEREQARNFDTKWRRGIYRIVTRAGQPIGGLLLEERDDHLFLADIQIDAPYRGRGLGTSILRVLIAEAAARRLPLRLRVLHLNRAKSLYERLGFRQYGITDSQYLLEKNPS